MQDTKWREVVDPTELLESPQIGEHLPEVLTPQEVDQLEASIDLSKWEGHRNRAIIEVLFSCGLRVSELVNLKLSNLYLEEEYVRVMGKGSKERLVPISQSAIHELKFWFDDRCHMTIKPGEEDYVFLNRYGKLRKASDTCDDPDYDQTASRGSWYRENHLTPHAASLICHSPVGRWCRSAFYSSTAGS